MSNRPIGVFDSGVGGLTVVQNIMKHLPAENIIYVGDTKNVPYGNKSRGQIRQYTDSIIKYLHTRHVKMIIIACNTATTVSQDLIQNSKVPVIGVIQPTAEKAISTTKNNRVAVIATAATIKSEIYKDVLESSGIKTFNVACPLFTPLIESGLEGTPQAQEVVKNSLSDIKNCGADTVVAGCTHYGLLKKEIKNVIGDINFIESGEPTAELTHDTLAKTNMLNQDKAKGSLEIFCTGNIEAFKKGIAWFGDKKVSGLNLEDKQIADK